MTQPKTEKLIAIDIGNTAVSYGLFQGNVLKRTGHAKTSQIPKLVIFIKQSGVNNSNLQVIISSVVPLLTNKLRKDLKSHIPLNRIHVIGSNVSLRVTMKYKAKQLGADRLVNLYGAIRLYQLPILIVDFGTAITFDYISRSGVFEGGLIVPGIGTSFDALRKQAALLPRASEIQFKRGLIGRDTQSAMSLGLLEGFGALTDGLIDRFRKKYGKFKVLATGGFASQIARYVSGFDRVDSLHTIRSLGLIYRRCFHG